MAVQHPKVNRSRPPSRSHQISPPKTGHNRTITIAIYLFLAGSTRAVFGQPIRYEFGDFDAELYVYDSTAIRPGLTIKGITLAFTNPHARNWHPLTTISHMLDCQLYGLNAGGHHATNVFLHMVAVLLLFRVLQQMTDAMWKSAIVAALFAVHPLHVESVAWISERKDVLSAVFFFLMLNAYIRYARAPSLTRYLVVALLLAAGLMSKQMLVTAPIVLLLLDYWPLNRIGSRRSDVGRRLLTLVVEKIPLFVLSAGAGGIIFVVQKRAVGAIPPLPLLWRVDNAVASYVIYIWKTLWPTRLAVFYPHPNDTIALWQVVLAIGLLLTVTVLAIVFQRERPYLFTGWFWYVAMLVPVIGLVQVGEQGYADRYTYLPHIGLFVLVVWGIADVTAGRPSGSRVAGATAVVIIVGLAYAAFIQTSYWRNSQILSTHAVAVTSDNDCADNNLG